MSAGSLLTRRVRLPRVARPDLWAVLGLVAVAFFFFRDVLLGRGVLFRRDISFLWYPQIESFVRCITNGSWPLWDAYRGFGQPLLADPSAEVLYPPTWMNLVAPPWIVYTTFVVFHLILSGVGLYALARRLGVSRIGAFTGGLAWMASGPLLSFASMWHHLAGAAWIPWVFFAAERAIVDHRPRHTLALGGVLAAQILAGSADMVAMTLVALTAFMVLHRFEWRRPSSAGNRRLAATIAIAVGLGLALSAAQWLPTLEMATRDTERLGLDAKTRTRWSVHPFVMLEAALPFRWNELPLSPPSAADLLDSREPLLDSIYLGIPILGLATAAAIGGGRGAALALVAGGAALFSLGRHAPVYGAIVWLFPPLRIFRFPAKALVITAFAVALLAALGFDHWRDGDRRSRRWLVSVGAPLALMALMTGAAVVLSTVATSLWCPSLLMSGPNVPPHAELLAPAVRRVLAGVLLACVTLLLSLSRGLPTGVSACGVGLALLLDLSAAHRGIHPVASRQIFTHRPEVLDALKSDENPRVYVYDYSMASKSRHAPFGETHPFSSGTVPAGWTPLQALTLASMTYLTPPTGTRWGVSGSYDLDLLGLQPRPLAELNDFLRQQEETPVHTRLLQMGSVSYVIDLAPPSRWPDLLPVAVVPSLFREPIRVFKVPNPLPRAYVVGRGALADGRAALDALAAPDFDPRKQVVLADSAGDLRSEEATGQARIVDSRPDRVSIDVALSAPGYLVLVDAHDPGWRVFVDGRRDRLLRANIAFRAVALPQGSHRVEFHYRPTSVLIGLAVSLATAIAMLAFAMRTRK